MVRYHENFLRCERKVDPFQDVEASEPLVNVLETNQ